jgi:hypothetical protein
VTDPDLPEVLEVRMEPWIAADAHNGGLEAQNCATESLYASGRRFYQFDVDQDPEPYQSEKLDPGPDPH